MNKQKLIDLIDDALTEANLFVVLYYNGNEKNMLGTIKALRLLRQEIQEHPNNINLRVLRAMKDVGIAGVKTYDPSALANAISKVISQLYNDVPNYKELTPLRMDFDKGDPI